ncbi:zinc finger CHY domain-containing protein [Dendryphion nanum]|uniref:Zinc finger CHY domain-containing protein n=1 Tax=Dendryphion nanum TaxID=256645 RepID=A0A9P9D597_9PLEO|nr:zinc finger CHY domain-containing protein [Dendryphion nanum]
MTPTETPPKIHGLSLTPTTQCAHYHTPLDILAIQHFCCRKFYACISCHNALETHTPLVWPKEERSAEVVFCGGCKAVLRIEEYMGGYAERGGGGDGGKGGSRCGRCGAGFNPGCRGHWGLYFEIGEGEDGR